MTFAQSLPTDWPLPAPQFVDALDADDVRLPPGWNAGRAAYGCALTHRRVLEEAARLGQSVLVLEDDAIFASGFTEGLASFAQLVPRDWQLLLLGGQHVHTPRRVSATVVRCKETARTHAYVARGRGLTALHSAWAGARSHIDRAWVDLQRSVPTYAPWPMLVGQAAGLSDITGLMEPEHFWD